MNEIIVMTPEQLQDIVHQAIRQAVPLGNHSKPGKKLLSGKEVEKEYGICDRNLERWRAEGIGPQYTTIGRRIFYEREVLDAFIAEGRVKTTGRAN